MMAAMRHVTGTYMAFLSTPEASDKPREVLCFGVDTAPNLGAGRQASLTP